jgi:hypothetical protein
MTRAMIRVVLGSVIVCLTAAVTLAQTRTATETKKFQVIAVDGNQLVVKLPEGTRELTVPEDFRFNVDGKELSVHELKAGMTGTATVTTKTTVTPVTVTEVKNGTVLHVAGGSIIVRTDEGNKMFTQSDIDKRGVKIMRGGKPAEISDFRANDRLTATIITTMPPKVVTEKEVQATLARSGGGTPAAPATAPARSPSSTPQAAGAPAATSGAAAAPSGAAPRKLPKTASPLPVLGLVGLASLVAGPGSSARRPRQSFHRRSGPFPAGAQARETSWPRCDMADWTRATARDSHAEIAGAAAGWDAVENWYRYGDSNPGPVAENHVS